MVLTYHEIVPNQASYLYGVTPEQLESHLKEFANGTPNVIDLLNRERQVSFDDGHVSHYCHALPLLREFSIKGTFFITAGWTGYQSDYMNVQQLKELSACGHRIQAHGWSHRVLTLCSPARLLEELRSCKDALEDWLGIPVEALSVPHGRWNERVLEVSAHLGFKQVYTSDPRLHIVKRHGVDLIGRLMVTRTMSARVLSGLLRGNRTQSIGVRVKDNIKSVAKTALGERGYHKLWTFVADPFRTVTLNGFSGPAHEQTAPPNCSSRSATVLQLISSGGYYGAESVVINLAKSLEKTSGRAIIGVFNNSQSPHTEIAERAKDLGLNVELIPCNGRLDWNAVRRIRQLIYKHGADIVHTHGSKANFYAAFAARRLGVPLIATYHLEWPDRGAWLHAYHALDRVVLRRYQKVIAVSGAIELSLRRAGINRRKLTTIDNGIDLTPFSNASNRAPELCGPPGTINIGLIGRLTPQKGHKYLIEAAPKILANYSNVKFFFVGDGPDRAELQRIVSTLGLEEHIVFTGSLCDMPSVYAAVDLLVLPSVNEGMPMTLIEALAAGKPVIATKVGDVPKLIQSGKTGILIEAQNSQALENSILQALADPAQLARLGAEGQRWVFEKFSSDLMASRYCEVYKEALPCT